jgi:hypothetical protein
VSTEQQINNNKTDEEKTTTTAPRFTASRPPPAPQENETQNVYHKGCTYITIKIASSYNCYQRYVAPTTEIWNYCNLSVLFCAYNDIQITRYGNLIR